MSRHRPLRIAQVATSDLSIRFLLAGQIQALERAGFEVTSVCAPGPYVAEARDLGFHVVEVPMARTVRPLQDLRSIIALVRLFRRERFDIVHTHTPKAGLLGPLAARLAGVPVIVHTVHGFLFHDRMPRLQQGFFRIAERFTAACTHHMLFQSREDLAIAVRARFKPERYLSYLGNGIDTARFDPAAVQPREAVRASLGIAPGELVVGTVGRLTWEKGYADFFEAARAVMAQRPEVRFLVVGPEEPDQSDAVPAKVMRDLEATGRVRFLGMRKDVQDLYGAMDVFVLASHREGIPRALMEACALERPCIATDIRGCREVIASRASGLLVPVRDAPALARAMLEVLDRPDRGRSLGLAARPRILAHFDERLVERRLVDVLARAAGEGEAAPVAAPGVPA